MLDLKLCAAPQQLLLWLKRSHALFCPPHSSKCLWFLTRSLFTTRGHYHPTEVTCCLFSYFYCGFSNKLLWVINSLLECFLILFLAKTRIHSLNSISDKHMTQQSAASCCLLTRFLLFPNESITTKTLGNFSCILLLEGGQGMMPSHGCRLSVSSNRVR